MKSKANPTPGETTGSDAGFPNDFDLLDAYLKQRESVNLGDTDTAYKKLLERLDTSAAPANSTP